MSVVDYKSAGVDIDAGESLVEEIKPYVEKTFNPSVLSNLGGFAGLYSLPNVMGQYSHPVLVQSIDGVGTKSIIARMMDDYSTLGRCLVSATVNDILVCGAKPLTLLDYVASDRLNPLQLSTLIKGIAISCKEYGIALVGGETAEMPDTYQNGEVDVVGVITGVVEKKEIINGSSISPGDKIIGLSSTGLHTNGYSLARHVVFDLLKYSVDTYVDELGETIGESLLRPHYNYCNEVQRMLSEKITITGMSHITGGGIPGNLVRILPANTQAVIRKDSWFKPSIFSFLEGAAKIESAEMYRAFNMGVGYICVLKEEDVDKTLCLLNSEQKESAFFIGDITEGNKEVIIK
jgi:phosphoribosylformylglycinamidine cyclo-ligase